MQRGFLNSQPISKAVDKNDAPKPTTEEQLQECIGLLRGPGDERKYVDQIFTCHFIKLFIIHNNIPTISSIVDLLTPC
jgi:hypothetical protein